MKLFSLDEDAVKPQELAGAAVFLASDEASYINGHMLHVDGGAAEVLSLPVAVTSAAEVA